MKLTSTAFHHGKKIPSIYTCDGKNISPPLSIAEAPEGTQSFVLLMDDPDIPDFAKQNYNIEVWDHWVVFNIPPDTTEIPEGKNPKGILGKNTRGNLAYGGPCPPDREHRYMFKLYALHTLLSLEEGATKKEVEQAMKGKIIEETVLIGVYERQQQ